MVFRRGGPRRRFRRIRRRLRRKRTLPSGAMSRLRRAHDSLETGKYQEAAMEFSELARDAEARGFPQSANLHLQASFAFIKVGLVEQTVEQAQRGLRVMASSGRIIRLKMAGRRVVTMLREHGFSKEAESIETVISELLAKYGAPDLSQAVEQRKKGLPGKCPSCGGTVLANEVEWIDEQSASCDYCGSLIEVG